MSLPDTLDNLKSKTAAMYVNILQKNKKDVTSLVLFGAMGLSYGFGIYYLLPLSLISYNFSLAMTLFLGILFGMIISMALLAINLMPMINQLISKLFLFFESNSTRLLVNKNLMAHRDRNRQTAMILSLTLAFIIFLNIVARIPFAYEEHDALKIKGRKNIKISRMNLPIAEFDEFLQGHEDKFEDLGLISSQMYNKGGDLFWDSRQDWHFSFDVNHARISDLARRKQKRVGILGAS